LIVSRNHKRARGMMAPDAQTGMPDDYIDTVLGGYLREAPRVSALTARVRSAWERLLPLIHERVMRKLRAYYSPDRPEFERLLDDLEQHCASLIWLSLPRYPYDTALEAWISRFVYIEVRKVISQPGFAGSHLTLSLDHGISDDATPLGDSLPDKRADAQYEDIDLKLTLEHLLRHLSADQRELVLRDLYGQSNSDIAHALNRTENAIYKLRQRAYQTMRDQVQYDKEPSND